MVTLQTCVQDIQGLNLGWITGLWFHMGFLNVNVSNAQGFSKNQVGPGMRFGNYFNSIHVKNTRHR